MNFILIARARPNFMKIAPIIHAHAIHSEQQTEENINYCLVHTGQHYDHAMSETSFVVIRVYESTKSMRE